jgi:hypothetical protein
VTQYPGTCLEELRKPPKKNFSQYNRSWGQRFEPWISRLRSRNVNTGQRSFVIILANSILITFLHTSLTNRHFPKFGDRWRLTTNRVLQKLTFAHIFKKVIRFYRTPIITMLTHLKMEVSFLRNVAPYLSTSLHMLCK